MSPELEDGDYVLAYSFGKIAQHDLVVVSHSRYGVIVKKVAKVNEDMILLTGENEHSVSSEQMGWISMSEIRGKVLTKIRS